MFTTRFQAWVRRIAMRAMSRVQRLPITPNQLTIAGLAISAVAALLVSLDHPFSGGLVLLFAGVFDIFDGALARASNRSYPYGAFLDSTTDRMAEGIVMLSLAIYFERQGIAVGPVLVLLAMAGSYLVSYVRARAQSLGFACEGGLLARPERVQLTVVGLLLVPLHPAGLLTVVVILAVFTNLPAIQRVWIVWRQSRQGLETDRPMPSEPARTQSDDLEVRSGPEPAGG